VRTRTYTYHPKGARDSRDTRSLWLSDRDGIWLSRGWLPPAALLPGGAGDKGALRLDRAQAAWLLSRWRVAKRTAGARLSLDGGGRGSSSR
jgi:hypothetical protein